MSGTDPGDPLELLPGGVIDAFIGSIGQLCSESRDPEDGRRQRSSLRSVSNLKASYEKADLDDLFAEAAPPTEDDVSVTNDGRRLDSAEAVIAFFEEMKAERAESLGDG